MTNQTHRRRSSGFRTASSLLEKRINKAGASRGFTVLRLLTHWSEIVGDDLADRCRPAKVNYGKGFGATLTLVCSGAAAPIVQMQAPRIIQKVNACYGYAAISRIHVTQTAADGFAEPQAEFRRAPRQDPEIERRAAAAASDISDPDLRAALETLARNVLARNS